MTFIVTLNVQVAVEAESAGHAERLAWEKRDELKGRGHVSAVAVVRQEHTPAASFTEQRRRDFLSQQGKP